MARIEDLIEEIQDPDLRDQISRQVKQLKSTKRFGLVFEDHVPETVSLFGLPVRPGSIVQNRRRPDDQTRLQVLSVAGDKATVAPVGADEPVEILDTVDLLVVKAFQEPIFPGLTPVGDVRRGPEDKPAHTVISGENFHALQLLAYTHAGGVDVIYIDPPYNTGARDWKYNNRFVDNNDSWRHSKWLAMMEKRLRLSRKLLKPDGVLIVTIDEHEVHHLGLLLADLFPDARRQMVTTVISSQGSTREGMFSRADEHIFFVFMGDSRLVKHRDDMLNEDGTYSSRSQLWFQYIRGGKAGRGTRRADSKNLFFPIFAQPNSGRIVSIGDPLPLETSRHSVEVPDGLVAIWPLFDDGGEGRWRTGVELAREWADRGFLRLGRSRKTESGWSAMSVRSGTVERIERGEIVVVGRADDGSAILEEVSGANVRAPKTVWNKVSHNAGWHGTKILTAFLPDRTFPFPKSVYAVADTLSFFVKENPDATVLDFFAGSGTTLHAVAMLNAQDGGFRRCILVTNNDVAEAEAKRMNKAGHFAGDPEFESHGIFEAVTKPRAEAAIRGLRTNDDPVPGKYLDEYLDDHTYAKGFAENASFFRMDYLEPDLVELGRQFNAIAPLLWMTAGSIGLWEEWDGEARWTAPASSTYAVLFDLAEAPAFGAMVESRPEITHTWIVTDSHTAFVELRAELPDGVKVGQLYREYLRNFTVNTSGVLD